MEFFQGVVTEGKIGTISMLSWNGLINSRTLYNHYPQDLDVYLFTYTQRNVQDTFVNYKNRKQNKAISIIICSMRKKIYMYERLYVTNKIF